MRFAAAALVAVLLAAPDARADGAEAAATERFRRGAEAYRQHDYRAAAVAFEAAHRIVPNAATLYNAALAWSQLPGEEIHAANDLATALELGTLGDAQAADARRRLAQLDQSGARLEVTGPAGTEVGIDQNEPSHVPASVRLAVGQHDVTATFPGGKIERRRVTAERGSITRVDLDTPAETRASPGGALYPPAPPAPPPETDEATPPKTGGRSDLRTLGWVGIGGGAVLAGAGVYLGLTGLSARDDFEAGGRLDASLRDRAVSHRTWANVTFIGAAVVAGAGTLLVLRF